MTQRTPSDTLSSPLGQKQKEMKHYFHHREMNSATVRGQVLALNCPDSARTESSCMWPELLHAGQEAAVRTGHGTAGWFPIGKGARQGCILSPCLFNLHAEYIMRNAGLEETQAGIKTARRNINNLRYADDTTLMAENEEELKSFLMKVKEENEKVGLKFNIQKTKIMPSGPSLHGKQMGKQWKQWLTLFFWAPKSLQMVIAAMKLKDAYSLEGKL